MNSLDSIIFSFFFSNIAFQVAFVLEEDDLIQSPKGRAEWQREGYTLKTVFHLELGI